MSTIKCKIKSMENKNFCKYPLEIVEVEKFEN